MKLDQVSKTIIDHKLYYKFPRITNLIASLKTKPYFLLVGAQKCGTTTLYDQLIDLPMFQPAYAKEIPDLSFEHCKIDLYRLQFPFKKKGKLTGNACHLDMYSPYGAINIKRYFPDAKIIFLLRDPVDRAYSHFNMDKKFNWIGEAVKFEDYVDFEMSILKNLENIYDLKELYKNTRLFNFPFGLPIGKGIYYSQIKHFNDLDLKYLTVSLEIFNKDFENEINRILNFLEINEKPEFKINMKKSNVSKSQNKIPKAIEERLIDFYKPHNKKLFDLLGTEYPWK